MQATITYLLTEQAQRAQMAATGQPVALKQIITAEIPVDALDLFSVSPDGEVALDLAGAVQLTDSGWKRGAHSVAAPAVKSVADIIADLRAAEVEAARKRAEQQAITEANGQHNRAVTEAAYQTFLADPSARLKHGDIRSLISDLRSPTDWWPEAHSEFVAEIHRRNRADSAAEEARKAAADQAKRDFRGMWIAAHADDLTKEQFAAGLLCQRTLMGMIADAAFAAARVPEEHPDSKVCDIRDCPCNDLVWDCLPTEVYARWSEIKSRLPEGSTAEFHRVRDCLRDEDGEWIAERDGGESATDPYYVAIVKIPHGPFAFERRVKLG